MALKCTVNKLGEDKKNIKYEDAYCVVSMIDYRKDTHFQFFVDAYEASDTERTSETVVWRKPYHLNADESKYNTYFGADKETQSGMTVAKMAYDYLKAETFQFENAQDVLEEGQG